MLRLQTPLPAWYREAPPEVLDARIAEAKAALGERCVILGHHYQRDEVIRFADARGDSLRLARYAAEHDRAEFVVFCGVHFMAESADILTGPHQQVILPDLNAGCSMADMADAEDVAVAWEELAEVTDVDRLVPITYINSSAAVKAFVGRHDGVVCTSSNARAVLRWALGDPSEGAGGRGEKVLFVPDQHLGRNTALAMGYRPEEVALYDPRKPLGGLEERTVKDARVLVWKGHCSVHQRFTTDQVAAFRAAHPEGLVVVHPECAQEVVAAADLVGSTDFIIATVAEAPPGAVLGVGTEIHLVHRLATEHPDKTVVSLDPLVCPCSTMFRIDPPHLAWVLDGLREGEVRNRITVDPETAEWARVALERMLTIS
jgi:quinolinate synthase